MELFLVRIQSKYRKIQTRNNSVFGHFSRSVYNDNISGIMVPNQHAEFQKVAQTEIVSW